MGEGKDHKLEGGGGGGEFVFPDPSSYGSELFGVLNVLH